MNAELLQNAQVGDKFLRLLELDSSGMPVIVTAVFPNTIRVSFDTDASVPLDPFCIEYKKVMENTPEKERPQW